MTFGPGYPTGIDCEWLASDQDRHVAVFITAGCAPIPAKILAPNYFEAMRDGVELLPLRTAPQLFIEVKRPDDYLDFAGRGLFVFDWWNFQAYDLVAAPAEPLTLDELPSDLGAIAAAVTFDLPFRTSRSIDVRAHHQCAERLRRR